MIINRMKKFLEKNYCDGNRNNYKNKYKKKYSRITFIKILINNNRILFKTIWQYRHQRLGLVL